MVGPDALAVCQAHRAYLLNFSCSGMQCYLLLSAYLCFISFLYIDFYVLGDNALISYESFMQTKHLCVLIHIWTKSEVDAPLNWFTSSSKIFLLTVPRRCFFGGSFCYFCLVFVMLSCASVIIAMWSPVGKGLTSWSSFVMSNCEIGTFHWYLGSYVVLDCIDS